MIQMDMIQMVMIRIGGIDRGTLQSDSMFEEIIYVFKVKGKICHSIIYLVLYIPNFFVISYMYNFFSRFEINIIYFLIILFVLSRPVSSESQAGLLFYFSLNATVLHLDQARRMFTLLFPCGVFNIYKIFGIYIFSRNFPWCKTYICTYTNVNTNQKCLRK